MPSPGGSVGVEMAYQYLFSGFFSNKLNSETFNTIVKSSLLIWRFITYYFSILFSAIIVLIYRGKKKLNFEKGEFYDYTKHKDKQ